MNYLIKPDGHGGRLDTRLAVELNEKQQADLISQGYYLIGDDDFNRLIGNAETAYIIDIDGTVKPAPKPNKADVLSNAKTAKIAELKAERDRLEVEPIASNGNTFDFDDKARERINAAIIALEGTAHTIEWTTADNKDVKVTADDLKAVVTAVAVRSNTLHVAYRTAKQQVLDAKTVDAVNAVKLVTN